MRQELLRQLPRTDALLASASLRDACARCSYPRVKEAVQTYLAALRADILAGSVTALPELRDMEQTIVRQLDDAGQYGLRRVVNATGVILHTNLGRSPLGGEIAAHIAEIAEGYSDLELDLATGRRGSRCERIESLLCELTGAEAAMVVTNNAGAVFLMLNTLAKGARVAVSRGELVEIGGMFRVPDILAQSGASLVEVGTTNRTRLSDYAAAVAEKQATVLLKVHTSNFLIEGFTEETALADLVQLGRENDLPVLYDAGAAFLFPPELLGIHSGTVVRKCVACGADAICFSGDKLLGLTQAGILVGRRDAIGRMRQNPLSRMLRMDKLSLAALEAGLGFYRDPALAMEKIPALAMAALSEAKCREKAERLAASIACTASAVSVCVVPVTDEVGGGSLPGVTLPGYAVAIESASLGPDALSAFLRACATPVIGRVRQGCVLLSVRTLLPSDEEAVAEAFAALRMQTDGETRP